ncbi:hypothetical protein ACB094_12G180400 [Castanea mollissima]
MPPPTTNSTSYPPRTTTSNGTVTPLTFPIIKGTTSPPMTNINTSPLMMNSPTPPFHMSSSAVTNSTASDLLRSRFDFLEMGSVSSTNPPLLTNGSVEHFCGEQCYGFGSHEFTAPFAYGSVVLLYDEDGHVEPCPSIKNFVEHKWVLELRDRRQIAIPLSLYHSPGSMSDFNDL